MPLTYITVYSTVDDEIFFYYVLYEGKLNPYYIPYTTVETILVLFYIDMAMAKLFECEHYLEQYTKD